MTQEIRIVPTTIEHIRMLVFDLRDDDVRECEKFGVSPFKGIWRSYKNSKICRSYFIGDRIAAICGVNGGLFGFMGNPWLMTSNIVNDYPFVFASIYRREMREMLKSYQTLESWVDASHTKSIKMMRIVGFKEREFKPCGKDGALLVRMEMA
jgi:hypothetical protein